MNILQTQIAGVAVVALNAHQDERGTFTRLFCAQDFASLGLPDRLVQWNLSQNPLQGTLRGLHWQDTNAPEDKLIHCLSGAIWDVAVDVRAGSKTYGTHFSTRLQAGDGRALQVPAGCAHGFLTLEPETTVLYGVSGAYSPKAERGARWDDPFFGIEWPDAPAIVSEKDRSWPDFQL